MSHCVVMGLLIFIRYRPRSVCQVQAGVERICLGKFSGCLRTILQRNVVSRTWDKMDFYTYIYIIH